MLTPHILRFPSITAENLRRLAAGTDSNVRVLRQAAGNARNNNAPDGTSGANPDAPHSASPLGAQPLDEPAAVAAAYAVGPATGDASGAAQLRFSPERATLQSGDSEIVGISVSGVSDLFSIPLLLKYDPAVIQITEVRDGGFLSGGTQTVAIVQRIDAQKGEVMISCTRGPHTAGVNGSGTILGLVVRAVGSGDDADTDCRSTAAGFAAAEYSDDVGRSSDTSAMTRKKCRRPIRHERETDGALGLLRFGLIAGYCAAFSPFFLGSPAGAGFQNVGSAWIISGPT